jgi:3-phosphoshikimate 1-carboxyvinyltransferase
MQAIIDPGYIKGDFYPPASKSMMQRVCAAALLHKGKTIIHNPGRSNDDKAALNIIAQLGATVIYKEKHIEIESDGINPVTNEINCGESGLSARLFIPISALANQQMTITGDGSLLQRPMSEFVRLLPELGISVNHADGHLPFTLQGQLQPKDIVVDGSLSSQYLSGVLFAFAYSATTQVTIHVTNLASSPYIDLTLLVLQLFGYRIQNENYERFIIEPKTSPQGDIEVTIESDWSSAAYWLAAGAIGGNVTVRNLNLYSPQADKEILTVLQHAEARMKLLDNSIEVKRGRLKAFHFDATHCPDLFPVLSILAACCKGESAIHGVHRLVHKESNRAASIAEMLEQFGVFYSVHDDTMYIQGLRMLEQATVDSYNDHRIAMSAAIAALRAIDTTIINNAAAVNKSYPEFFSHLQSAGIDCTLTD